MADRNSTNSILAFSIRLFWLFIGNIILIVLALTIAMHSIKPPAVSHCLFWVTAIAAIALRYADIRFFHGETADCGPATMAHFRGYAIKLAIFVAAIWGASLLAAKYLHF
jgi:hypothetical protein